MYLRNCSCMRPTCAHILQSQQQQQGHSPLFLACHMLMYSSAHSHRRSSTALKYSPISLSSANGSQPVTTLAFSNSSNVMRSNVPHNCTSAQHDHERKST